MIPEKDPVIPGMTVRHDEGLLYRVDDIRQSTTGYESTHELGGLVVNYTQLEEGSFPPGTKWSKDEEGFRAHFTAEVPDPLLSSEFVTLVEVESNGQAVPIITAQNLWAFSERERGFRTTGENVYNNTAVRGRLNDNGSVGILASFFEHDKNGKILGLKPDKLKEMVQTIKNNPGCVRRFGEASESLLLALHAELFPEE